MKVEIVKGEDLDIVIPDLKTIDKEYKAKFRSYNTPEKLPMILRGLDVLFGPTWVYYRRIVTKSGLRIKDNPYKGRIFIESGDSLLIESNDVITPEDKGVLIRIKKDDIVTDEICRYDIRGACIITTACTEAMGLPDNCQELQTLRSFRDGYIAKLPSGKELIKLYYQEAPRIVNAIQSKPNSRDIFSRIFKNDIKSAVSMIQEGNYEGALNHYMQVTERLKQLYVQQK